MSLKPNAQNWTVKEQIIEDPTSGITIQFEVSPDGEPFLRLYGDSLPMGNREIVFGIDGKMAGAGSAVAGHCRAAWLTSLDDV